MDFTNLHRINPQSAIEQLVCFRVIRVFPLVQSYGATLKQFTAGNLITCALPTAHRFSVTIHREKRKVAGRRQSAVGGEQRVESSVTWVSRLLPSAFSLLPSVFPAAHGLLFSVF